MLSVGAACLGLAGPPPAEAKRAKPPKAVRVELALTAREARWVPAAGRPGTGRLVLDGIGPRMHVMAVAPRREHVVTHASMLGANWKRLFGRQGGETNAILSAKVGGRPTLFPVRIELVRRHPAGRRMVFSVTPLRQRGHRVPRMGRSALTLEDPTLLVDPIITDAIKALWAALLAFFADDPTPAPLPNPAGSNGEYFDNGGGIYAGQSQVVLDWARSERSVLAAALGGSSGLDLSGEAPDVSFGGGIVNGAALFNHDFGTISVFEGTGVVSPRLRNFAVFESQVANLSFSDAVVDGANLRGTDVRVFTATNSAFNGIDFSGARLGSEDGPRSTVRAVAFQNVFSGREVNGPDGQPDRATQRGANLAATNTDFVSVSFQGADLRGATFTSTTFQGCALQRVDFRGATITGDDTLTYTDPAGERFQRLETTFADSILEDVSFDGARLTNVSFAGVDFSQGVSLDGAVLNNVDFTGAVGLQYVDWSQVSVEGAVYGLEVYGNRIGDLGNRDNLRSLTFDGVIPNIDTRTGFDVQPKTGWLIDPATGARLGRGVGDVLVPINPETNGIIIDPRTKAQLLWENGEVFDPSTRRPVPINYETGLPEFDR